VYALRVDRGLSPPEVLATVPGTRWSEERGLDEHQYIVPGAGGVGEILNNAWV
jgi:uracil phosphoribosyltransferase